MTAFAYLIVPWNGGPNQGFGNTGTDSVQGPAEIDENLSLFRRSSLPRMKDRELNCASSRSTRSTT